MIGTSGTPSLSEIFSPTDVLMLEMTENFFNQKHSSCNVNSASKAEENIERKPCTSGSVQAAENVEPQPSTSTNATATENQADSAGNNI